MRFYLIKQARNSVYIGTLVNGLRSGVGAVSWSNGSVYYDQWLNGTRNGEGTYLSYRGEKGLVSQYSGQWSNDERMLQVS
jgi:hypothetical protein